MHDFGCYWPLPVQSVQDDEGAVDAAGAMDVSGYVTVLDNLLGVYFS